MARRKWVYMNGESYEVGVDEIPENPLEVKPHHRVVGDSHYDGLRATDGTDISTRAKHRAYMKAHNLTTIDDYNVDAMMKRKAEYYTKGGTVKRQDIERAIYELQRKR